MFRCFRCRLRRRAIFAAGAIFADAISLPFIDAIFH
jgi:hypothetical protein